MFMNILPKSYGKRFNKDVQRAMLSAGNTDGEAPIILPFTAITVYHFPFSSRTGKFLPHFFIGGFQFVRIAVILHGCTVSVAKRCGYSHGEQQKAVLHPPAKNSRQKASCYKGSVRIVKKLGNYLSRQMRS